ncbi:MAG TPA: 4-hydroxy-tetrahydrodipicolinate synthase [Gammaproteobacteria bacterium]|nr:4-hydroxy-tetrahydrodipicolinate synthase [Gammaproteobacteria bacterium]
MARRKETQKQQERAAAAGIKAKPHVTKQQTDDERERVVADAARLLARAELRGSIPPLITPFKNDEVDYDAYAALVNFQIDEGSHGILVNGTTAEPSTLTTEERNRLVTLAIEVTAGRVPVVAATGSQSLAESHVLTEHAVAAGADSLLIVTPYYIKPPQRGLVAYYLELAKGHDLPWMIYHIPGRTAVGVTLDTLKACKDKSPTFVGIKHAVNDLGFVSECLHEFGADFRVFVGLEELSFPMMAVGACGLMNAVGNLRPGVLAQMCEAVEAGDLDTGRALHDQLLEINKAVFFDTNPIPMKYMMKKLGLLATNEHRLPMVPATADLAAKLDGVLERAKLGAAHAAVSRPTARDGGSAANAGAVSRPTVAPRRKTAAR